jgi:orotidine-5'-phosphate decarboxylase
MKRSQLIEQIRKKKSFLCIGLDTDLNKIPSFLLDFDDPIFEFNKRIIDATHDLCIAYKPNIAFYEALGPLGWESLRKTVDYIPNEIFTIADAKRGDIGNTSNMYAEAFFNKYNFDSITLSPYMGKDSITPFLNFDNKWSIVLALTSNKGALDFQKLNLSENSFYYEEVLNQVSKWGNINNTMFVVGATNANELKNIRKIVPDHFLLVPGVGAQGGDLNEVVKNGINDDIGLIINSSRGIIYAGFEKDFAEKAKKAAKEIQQKMAKFL